MIKVSTKWTLIKLVYADTQSAMEQHISRSLLDLIHDQAWSPISPDRLMVWVELQEQFKPYMTPYYD